MRKEVRDVTIHDKLNEARSCPKCLHSTHDGGDGRHGCLNCGWRSVIEIVRDVEAAKVHVINDADVTRDAEAATITATNARLLYTAYRRTGFNEEQAMRLLVAVIESGAW